MKFRVSLALLLAAGLAACAQQTDPAPVTGWHEGPHPARIVVGRGDTVSAIAHRYNMSVEAIADANRLGPHYKIYAGQTLVLPGGTATTPVSGGRFADIRLPLQAHVQLAAAVPPPPPAAKPERRIASREVPPPDKPAPPKPAATRAVASTVAPRPEPPPPPPSRPLAVSSRGFVWPVAGRIIEPYGPGPHGTTNDGINIAARVGTPVRAAAAGTVVYVGNQLRGYGNLVLLQHDHGYLTAYAHNEDLMVHKGEHVARGQAIARVGETGGVGEPQLHFEIRDGRRPVDPMPLLPPLSQAVADID